MAAGFTVIRVLLLCWFGGVGFCSTFPTGRRFVYPKAWHVGRKWQQEVSTYGLPHPLQNFQTLRHHGNFQLPVQAWQKPRKGFLRIPQRYRPNLYRQTLSPYRPQSPSAAKLPQEVPPPPGPRGFRYHQETPVPIKGSHLNDYSRYGPSSVHLESSFSVPSGSSSKGYIKNPKNPHEGSKQRHHLSLHVPQRPGSIVQKHYMDPTKVQSGSIQTGSDPYFFSSAGSVQQQKHLSEPLHTKHPDTRRLDFPGYPHQHTAPGGQIKHTHPVPIKHPSPTLPISNYPQHLDEDINHYNVQINPAKKHYGKGQTALHEQLKHPPIQIHPQHHSIDDYYGLQINPAKKHHSKGQMAHQQIKPAEQHQSLTLPIPKYPQHLDKDHLYHNVQVNPAKKDYGKGQPAPPQQIKRSQQHPIKYPSPSLPIPKYPQHHSVDDDYYGFQINPAKEHHSKGQTAHQQIRQAEHPSLTIPKYPQHHSMDYDYYGLQINPAKKHYGKGQTALQQIKQSQQHPIKQPSLILPTAKYPQHLDKDHQYHNVQVNPATKDYGKGQEAPHQIRQSQQHPIKHPSPTLPIPKYPQHLSEDHLYHNVQVNPAKKDYDKGQVAHQQIKQAEHPSLTIPKYPQHHSIDYDYYSLQINPAKKHYGKGQTALQQIKHPIKQPSLTLPTTKYPQHLSEDHQYHNVQVNPAKKDYGKGQPAPPQQIKQSQQHPSTSLAIPKHPQHHSIDDDYYGFQINPAKEHHSKGQVAHQQIKQAEQHPSLTLQIPKYPQHHSEDHLYHNVQVNPAKKDYGKGQEAPHQIKQSQQHPIKHPSPSLAIPKYPQHHSMDYDYYGLQINPAKEHHNKGQTAHQQIKQSQQHPIKQPSLILPTAKYPQHHGEDHLYHNVQVNPAKKDYGKGQEAPHQIRQSQQHPIKHPSPSLAIPIHPQHHGLDSDYYGFQINPAKRYDGKGPTSHDATNLHSSLHYEGLPGGHHHGQRYNEGETKHPVQQSNYNQFKPAKQIAASQHELPSSGLHHRSSVVTYGAGSGVQSGQNYEYGGGSSQHHVSGLLNFQHLLPDDDEFNMYDVKHSDWKPYSGKYPGQQTLNSYSIKI